MFGLSERLIQKVKSPNVSMAHQALALTQGNSKWNGKLQNIKLKASNLPSTSMHSLTSTGKNM